MISINNNTFLVQVDEELNQMVKRANDAQHEYSSFTQEKVDEIVACVAQNAYEASEKLARMAVEETGMGIAEHKKIKNELASLGVYEAIKNEKTVGIIHEDRKNKIIEIAEPFGVIACIIPTTNPTSTAIFKTLIALKTRNAVVVSPHPNAVNCTIEALKICNEAAIKAGAPPGLIHWITQPSLEKTNGLMKHRNVHLILATGGTGLVRAAYSSGKPAYGVGPGNVPVYLDKTCDVFQSVKKIVESKTFDNGTICATEQAVVVHKNIKSITIRELKRNGAHFLNDTEREKVARIISPSPGKLNPDIVGKSAREIAGMAGIDIPDHTKLIIAEETKIGKDVPFSIEKLAPIFSLYTASDEKEAIRICNELLNIGGRGHSFAIHSGDDGLVRRFSLQVPVSRILVNTHASVGAAGGTTGLVPSFTLGCGSYGGNITSDNITAKHLINIKRIAYETKKIDIPSPGEMAINDGDTNAPNIDVIIEQVLKQLNISSTFEQTKTVKNLVKEIVNQYEK